MKRKRGFARRKPRRPPVPSAKETIPNVVSLNAQDEWGLDDYNDNELDGRIEIETPQKGSSQQKHRGGLRSKKVVELTVKDCMSSFAELNVAVSTNLSKKSRSKMCKSSNEISSSSTKPSSNVEQVHIGNIGRTHQKELKLPNQDPEYKEEELKSVLKVIRKVMKMDMTGPFNVPVDPIALGIPDYFDIIETPMDFGTICSNLETGVKYKNSKDVISDVQYIWDNCCKYNKKGDYILEIKKRVKKNFTKFWMEAGLWREQQQEIDGDTHLLPPAKPTTTCSIYGHRTPLGSLADCARNLLQDQEELSRPQTVVPSSTWSQSCQSQQRPSRGLGCSEAAMRRSPHDCSADPMDNISTHPQQRQTGSNQCEIQHYHSSLGNSEPYQPQKRSCQCHPSFVQLQPYHQQAGTFILSPGHSHITPPVESSVRGSPCRRGCLGSPLADNSTCSQLNQISSQLECHEHQSSLYCSQPCQPRRESCHCMQSSGPQHHSQPFHGLNQANAGGFDSQHSERCKVSCTKQGSRCSTRTMTDYIRQQDQIASSCLNLQQPSGIAGVEEEYFCPPPSESMVTAAKRGPTKYSADPMTEFINCEQLDQIASNQKHHHKPQRGSCQGQLGSIEPQFSPPQPSEFDGVEEDSLSPSPSDSMLTAAKCGPSKYSAVPMTDIINRERLDQTVSNQTQSQKPHEPQRGSCQSRPSSSQPQFSPPQALWDMYYAVSNKTKKKTPGRGPTRCLDVWETEDKIPITTNEFGQPIGSEAPKLNSFLGIIARNGHIAPLIYVMWKALPDENKEKMWQLVQSKFDIDPGCKIWVLKSISRKWSAWKALLKANHYTPHETDEERLADCNERVLPDQWRILVSFWNSPEAKECSTINKANRAKQKLGHAAGSKSFARVREEQRLKRPGGKEPSQADMFILTRTGKDGRPVNEASSLIISQLHDAVQQQGTSRKDTIEDDIFNQVVGEERRRRGRAFQPCSAPSNNSSKPIPYEAVKMVSVAKAEVREMKEKMVAVEQTCAQMAAQMAAMMSMMQQKFPNNPPPNLNASNDSDGSEHSSSSRHGLPSLQPSTTSGQKRGTSVGKRSTKKSGKKQGTSLGKVARKN